jgi:hypothetical protein
VPRFPRRRTLFTTQHMDDLVRTVLESPGAWGSKSGKSDVEPTSPPDLRADLTARVVALLVERAGGRPARGRQPDVQWWSVASPLAEQAYAPVAVETIR